MKIISIADPQAIPLALAALSRGELVIYPTETCYGIAADTTNQDAITKLLSYKGDRYRQVAIAVSNREMANQYIKINEIADNLYTHFLPGPITVISESLNQVDERLESATGTLGIRLPAYPLTLDLIRQFGRPVTATSANTSGKKEPYCLADWQEYTTRHKQSMVALFLDAGKLADRPTSTVVDTTLNDPQVLRQGEITLPELSPSLTSTSPATTQQIASDLTLKHLNLLTKFPLIFALQGDLGVGKTQFSKGIAAALGITETVASPTYTLLHEYPFQTKKCSGTFYHLDTWRLSDPTELESTLHLSTLLQPGNVFAIEWAGKAQELLKSYEKDIPIILVIIKEIDVNTRQITYAFSTPEWS
ncbi:MAG: L-threonylcarbamoyladenylate synthase [bacterium]